MQVTCTVDYTVTNVFYKLDAEEWKRRSRSISAWPVSESERKQIKQKKKQSATRRSEISGELA